LFIISYGQAGASFVSYRHTSFLKKHSYLTNQVRGHTSFLVYVCVPEFVCFTWFFLSYHVGSISL